MISVSIVIPNWNGRQLLEKQLPTVLAAVGNAEIIVVDDASGDNSVAFLRDNYPTIQVVTKSTHEGFASTVNAGVLAAKGEVVVLLNTDVRPHKDFLAPLVSHFSDKRVFAVGCLDRSHEYGEITLRGRGIAHWSKGFFIHAKGDIDTTTTAWVSGGSGAFRREYWLKLGGMDSLYNPFYWEDIDLSYRALKSGWRLVFEPKSIVDHYHEEGKILTGFTAKQIKEIAYRNQFIFIWKNLSFSLLYFSHGFWLPIRLLQACVTGDISMLKGYWDALWRLPSIWKKRQQNKLLEKVADSQVQLF